MSHQGEFVYLKQPRAVADQGQRAQDCCSASIAEAFVSRDQPGTFLGLLEFEAKMLDLFTVLRRD
jgi:hypothetical protein